MTNSAKSFRSQHGEDRLILERFRSKRRGYFVEVGALDGETLSNTYALEVSFDWNGLLVEANPLQAELARLTRPKSRVFPNAAVAPEDSGKSLTFFEVDGFPALSSFNLSPEAHRIIERSRRTGKKIDINEIQVEAMTLDEMLSTGGAPVGFEFLSIDIEGYELEALRGFNLRRWQPAVVLVENNDSFPNRRLNSYFAKHGYQYVRTLAGINEWWEPAPKGRSWSSRAQHYWDYRSQMLRSSAKRILQRVGLLGFVNGVLSRISRH